jgi:hypothetical protein
MIFRSKVLSEHSVGFENLQNIYCNVGQGAIGTLHADSVTG